MLIKEASQTRHIAREITTNIFTTLKRSERLDSSAISEKNNKLSDKSAKRTEVTVAREMATSETTTFVELGNEKPMGTDSTSLAANSLQSETCYCGAPKPHVQTKCAHCSNCNKFVCMYPGCKHTGNIISTVSKHQGRAHKGEFFMSLYSSAYCSCGQVKSRELDGTYKICPRIGCTRFWCNRKPCFRDYVDYVMLRRHWKLMHKTELLEDTNRCGSCKNIIKPRNPPPCDILQCNNCNIYWCLVEDCPLEFITFVSAKTHRTHAHESD